MAFAPAAPDISGWLGRKYAILQQQANAADTQNANQKIGIVAQAAKDNAMTALIPKQGAADIAKTTAETGLIGETTKWFGPEAQARIGNLNASAYATRIGGDVAKREGLDTVETSQSSLAKILGLRTGATLPGMGSVFSPVADTRSRMALSGGVSERRLPGETEAQYLDRINGL